ncbi:MAG: preprotein translocase subunit SecA [Patescibacteria group bacterium]|nr:preprotein translocase subunit SecA [Patescibacteria group bacterium]MDD5295183.1 preprotein translocase subunit SecA [Patescibacteria group bacterium]MDD5554618.1 preprotein translocase subunit SecA [Patescibacteria group bacterium]
MSILTKIFGDPNEKIVKSLEPIIGKINALEPKFEKMSDEELKGMTAEFRKRLGVKTGETGPLQDGADKKLDEILPEAFAAVREAAKRVLGQRHYDVQLVGGIVLHHGQIAEMRTGEGKTLVATLPLYLNALAGQGAHLVTVNDYLSRVGAGWMAPVFYLLGLSTGVIVHDTAFAYDPEFMDDSQYDDRLKHFKKIERKEAYNCDITYGTNNEFGFDYLRDNMAPSLKAMVQRGLYYTIVDEIDSILIDEARTPLIISAPAEESTDKYYKFSQLVERLKENEDYNIDEKMRAATLTEAGIAKMENWLGVENIYVAGGIRDVHHIEQALKARVLFKKDRDYVIKEGQVIIVDEFTGRLMFGRRYSEGLHQAIEAKENVEIQRESQTLATITFQNYFRMYKKLSGMTGTAVTEAEEFSKIYKLETVVIPTNKPMIRKDMNDLIYRTEEGKFKAVIENVKERNKKGQPVLIGTISIEKNELLAEMMEREGLHPQVLNAKNHEKEAQFIAQAGRLGAITVATNMAGRGVDIILGGNPPDKEEQKKVIEAGGLHVLGTERHEARRIDNQLRGRSGRQGDPGSSQFYVSTEDDLMRIFGGDRMKGLMKTLHVPEDMPIENRIVSKSIESAQMKVEGNNFDVRKHLVEYDDVINKHRESIYRKRREILELAENSNNQSNENDGEKGKTLSDIILDMVENEIEQVVSFHTASENIKDWNLAEIYEVAATIFPVEKGLKKDLSAFAEDEGKLNKAKARTVIIEHLAKLAQENYEKMKEQFRAINTGFNFSEIEKAILIRSIDTLWIEHLDAMDYMRRGIGLRGYGQHDPLVEYKKEAYHLFNELNGLIQKEVVYSVFKVGDINQVKAPSLVDRAKQFSAPAKTMDEKTSSNFSGFKQADKGSNSGTIDMVKPKLKDAAGEKIGRNDPCPCGSGKKYKKCCGK